jgi:hypothetical protein
MPDYYNDSFLNQEKSYSQRSYTPSHYSHGIEPLKYISSWRMSFEEGNVVKYITRWKYKGGLDDLYKAREYLNFLIAANEGSQK